MSEAKSVKVAEVTSFFSRWAEELKDLLDETPEKITKAIRQSGLQPIPLFTEFAKKTKLYRKNGSYSALWDFLSKDEQIVSYISDVPLTHEVCTSLKHLC